MQLNDVSIVLVGAGNMGGAMMGGWLENGIAGAQINVLDPAPPADMVQFINKHQINHQTDVKNLSAPDVLLVAVKPQIMGDVLDSVRSLMGASTVVVSVAAGKTLAFMQAHLGEGAMVRAMPNTPALIQRGITVACGNPQVSKLQREHVLALLGATGSVEWIDDETLMDAVTAVSGSGPAYVFHLAEALGDAAIAAGLPEALGRKLALETIAGAGALMMASDVEPAQLRKNVTSKGGTTQAALEVLMGEDGFPSLLERAVSAASKRSRELSKD